MEGEEIQIVFSYKVILFEYNDSTTLLQNVGVISSVVSHESAQKKNVRTNASHSWKLFPFTLIVINQNFYFLNYMKETRVSIVFSISTTRQITNAVAHDVDTT